MESLLEVFVCYAEQDQDPLNELLIHLGVLKRQGYFNVWHAREISPGTEWAEERDKHLNTAHIILLLISQYFVNSNYCYLIEMNRAIKRHEEGEARVIPIILRPVHYEKTPFARLEPLPTNHKPLLGSAWPYRDEAYYDVAEGIRKVAVELSVKLRINQQGRSL